MSEPVSSLIALFVALGKFIIAHLPGAAGAGLSLKFLGTGLSLSQKATSFVAGYFCSVYLAPAVIEFCQIKGEHVHAGIQFLVGLFALAVVRELFVEINNADLIGAFKRRFLGGDK